MDHRPDLAVGDRVVLTWPDGTKETLRIDRTAVRFKRPRNQSDVQVRYEA